MEPVLQKHLGSMCSDAFTALVQLFLWKARSSNCVRLCPFAITRACFQRRSDAPCKVYMTWLPVGKVGPAPLWLAWPVEGFQKPKRCLNNLPLQMLAHSFAISSVNCSHRIPLFHPLN